MSDALDSSRAERPQRQSCCLTVFALGSLALFGAAFLGHSLFTRHYEQKALDDAKVSREDLRRWLAEPVDVPPEYLEDYPDDSDEYVKRRIRVVEDTLSAMAVVDKALYAYPERLRGERVSTSTQSAMVKLLDGGELNTTDTRAVAQFQPDLPNLLRPVEELVQDPAYRYFARSSITMRSPWRLQRKLLEYAVVKHAQGDSSASLYCLRLAMQMTRRDLKHAEDSFIGGTLVVALGKLKTVASETTDTAILRQILISLEEAVGPPPSPRITRFAWIWPDEPLLAKRMVAEGYLSRMPVTRGDYVSVMVGLPDYVKWLEKHKPDAPRLEILQERADVLFSHSIDELKKLWSYRFGKKLFARLYFTIAAIQYYNINAQVLERHINQVAVTRFYLLYLAQRIARLEGNTAELTTPQDFVPEYLVRFPADPYTTGVLPLRYAPGKGFYSVGADGLTGTADDLLSSDALDIVLPKR